MQLENDLLTQESQTAAIQAEFEQARMQAEADEALAKEQLIRKSPAASPNSRLKP